MPSDEGFDRDENLINFPLLMPDELQDLINECDKKSKKKCPVNNGP